MHAQVRLVGPLAGLVIAAATAGAQVAAGSGDTFAVAGRAVGRDGEQIAGVQIRLLSRPDGAPAISSDDGRFTVAGLRRSGDALLVRRVGYRADTIALSGDTHFSGPLIVGLEALPQRLAPVVVRAGPRIYSGPFAQFNQRRDRGFGTFITRADIAKRKAYRTSDIFRSVANMNVERAGSMSIVRMRGRACDPLVWMDGVPLVGGFPDLDAMAPSSIEGIEIYNGVATIPPELIGPRDAGGCGVIVLWSRHGEPNRRRAKRVSAATLLAEVDAQRVFTPDSVDVPAVPLPDADVTPRYPEEMDKERRGGMALVEFVVDSAGVVEDETVGFVAITEPRLAEPVREALRSARFSPGVRAGRPVRQVVQLRFNFEPKPGGAPAAPASP